MQQKKKGRGLAVCLALCFTLLCGGTFVSHAVTPVCGGDHNWGTVREVGRINAEPFAHVHWHNGHWCAYQKKQDAILQRCECKAEQVVGIGGIYTVHEKLDM